MNITTIYPILHSVPILKTVREQIFTLSKQLVVSTIKIIRKLRFRFVTFDFHLEFQSLFIIQYFKSILSCVSIHSKTSIQQNS
jgi:hypothetical protein